MPRPDVGHDVPVVEQPAAAPDDARVRAALEQRTERWWLRLTPLQRGVVITLDFVVIFALWELAIGVFELVNPIFMPAPSRIFSGIVDLFATGEIYPHMRISATAWVIGYLLSAVIGIAVGFLLAGSRIFAKLGGPWIWRIYAAPWIAFQPLFVVWFGFGLMPVIFIVFTAAVFAVIFNTAAGVQTVNDSWLRCASVFGAGRWKRYRTVIIPAVFPFILVGLRHAVVIATGGLIVGELTSTTVGLGALVAIKTAQFNIGAACGIIVLMVVFTVLVGQALAAIARKVAPWHGSGQGR
jgi:ABC-type nitrate/sulfonate/bicarbonate transport system permease component